MELGSTFEDRAIWLSEGEGSIWKLIHLEAIITPSVSQSITVYQTISRIMEVLELKTSQAWHHVRDHVLPLGGSIE